MAVTNKHGQFSASLFSDDMGAGPAVLFGGQLRSALRTGTDVRQESTDGYQYPTHQAIYAQEPVAELQSYSLQTVLDQIGTLGKCVSGATNPGFTIYAWKRECQARATGNTSRAYKLSEGLIVPETISCTHRGDATLDYRCDVIYDGTNEPIVIQESQPIPTVANNNERFTIGPLSIGGATYDHVTQVDITFGVNVIREAADSDIWSTHISINDVLAMVRIRGIDPTWFAAAKIPFAGGQVTTHANGAIYLRRRDRSTVSQFAAGTANISFTFDGLAYITDAFDATGQASGECEMMIPVIYDGTNAPLVYNSGVALP